MPRKRSECWAREELVTEFLISLRMRLTAAAAASYQYRCLVVVCKVNWPTYWPALLYGTTPHRKGSIPGEIREV